MAIPVMNFQPESFQQANPFLTGMQAGQGIAAQGIQNAYLAPELASQLQARQLQNQMLQAQVPYAAPQAAAALGLAQARIPQTEAQTGLLQAQTQFFPVTAAGKYYQGMGDYLRGMNYFNPLSNVIRMQNSPVFQQNLAQNPQLLQQVLRLQNLGATNPMALTMMGGGMGMPGGMGLPGATISNAATPNMSNSAINLPQSANQVAALNAAMANQGMSPNSLTVNPNDLSPYQNVIDQQIAKTTGYTYSKLPEANKSQQIAQAAGMGFDPSTASNLFMQGKTVRDLAQQAGFDPNNLPDPIYPTTQASINRIQQRQQANAEINTLNPIITKALAPYSQRIAGYSPKQIAQAMSNDNPDQQARFLAAKALNPEMASLRLKAMGGQVGIEAIREVQNASMGNIKSFQRIVTPQVYTMANQYIDQWIQQGADAANSVGIKTFPQTTQQIKTNIQQGNQANVPPQNVANQFQGVNAPQMSKVLNGITYTKINGRWYQQ